VEPQQDDHVRDDYDGHTLPSRYDLAEPVAATTVVRLNGRKVTRRGGHRRAVSSDHERSLTDFGGRSDECASTCRRT